LDHLGEAARSLRLLKCLQLRLAEKRTASAKNSSAEASSSRMPCR
jgi:hypothetical protein